jgi:queuine tRNA-ribosyltransferase
MMVFDECPVYPSDYTYLKASAERTLRWAQRSKDANTNKEQALFGIVQGGQYSDLRYKSAQDTVKIGFDGYAIGGVALGEPKDVMYKMIEDGIKYLPDNKPRYLMGVGSIDGILEGIQRGVDMFDCVLPTRLARHGAALTHHGRVNIRDKKHEYDANRLDDKCQCSTCQTYSLAYLHHLYKAEELTVKRLLSIHNITFLFDLVANARIAIENDRFNEYKDEVYAEYGIERIQKSGF